MELTKKTIKKLQEFKFRYAEEIEGSVYSIKPAKEIWRNPQKPHYLERDRVCFWHDDCCDHPCCIDTKNILLG